MTEIVLFHDRLSGTIPSSLGAMTALRTLVLWGNQWSSTIPLVRGIDNGIGETGIMAQRVDRDHSFSSLLTWTAVTTLQVAPQPVGGGDHAILQQQLESDSIIY
jgi:hypothetical protein